MATTPGQDEEPQTTQDVPIWMVAPEMASWRLKKEVERHGKKALKAAQVGNDWYYVAQDRGRWRSAWSQTWHSTQQCTTKRKADRRAECAM